MVVVQAGCQAATGKMFTIPDEHDAGEQRAVDRIKDKDATRCEDAGNLFDRRGQVLHVLKRIEANND